MADSKLFFQLQRLDSYLFQYWEQKLLAGVPLEVRKFEDLELLRSLISQKGFTLNIGGNNFEIVGSQYFQTLQSQFSDVQSFGTVFIVQQDVHPIFLDSNNKISGGLAGGEFYCFGNSVTEFFTCLADCFALSYEQHKGNIRNGNGYDDDFMKNLKAVVKKYDSIAFEAWFEYFFG